MDFAGSDTCSGLEEENELWKMPGKSQQAAWLPCRARPMAEQCQRTPVCPAQVMPPALVDDGPR